MIRNFDIIKLKIDTCPIRVASLGTDQQEVHRDLEFGYCDDSRQDPTYDLDQVTKQRTVGWEIKSGNGDKGKRLREEKNL